MIPKKIKPILFGLSAFTIYAILTLILRLAFGKIPTDAIFFNIYTKNDLLIGIAIALAITVTHERKKANFK